MLDVCMFVCRNVCIEGRCGFLAESQCNCFSKAVLRCVCTCTCVHAHTHITPVGRGQEQSCDNHRVFWSKGVDAMFLTGGEGQRAALMKTLVCSPGIEETAIVGSRGR